MNECRHSNLVVLTVHAKRLRCRFCHLIIKEAEVAQGYCPECFEARGKKRDDFEPVVSEDDGLTRYRCEDCGAMLMPYKA